MKRLMAKMRRIRTTRWNRLTLGEKIAKTVMKLVKWALIIAAVLAVVGVAASIIFAFFVAFGIASAISGGLMDASRAYRPGDHYVRFR